MPPFCTRQNPYVFTSCLKFKIFVMKNCIKLTITPVNNLTLLKVREIDVHWSCDNILKALVNCQFPYVFSSY